MIESFESHNPSIDKTAWVHSTAVVIGRVTLGADVSIWPNTTLRGDDANIVIGDHSNIQDGTTVHMTGGVSETIVGRRVTVGHNCILHGCRIEDDVLIGMGSIIMDNVKVGAGSFIGAGTLIPPGKEIPPKSFVRGNPMQIVRDCGPREATWIDYSWQHYVENGRKHASSGKDSER
jgi:gamma-carbonic anhydrase